MRARKPPSKADVKDEARGRYEEALAAYEAVNASLVRRPVRPGFAWSVKEKRLVLRGEWADVPRRFLDFSGGRSECYGDVDDRAQEFHAQGIQDGDELREWMLRAKRPVLRDFEDTRYNNAQDDGPMTGAERQARYRKRLGTGRCVCSQPARPGINPRTQKPYRTCEQCNAASKEAMKAWRRRKALDRDREPDAWKPTDAIGGLAAALSDALD